MSNKLYDFKSSLQTGKIGEELVLNWIINNEKIKEFQDVREVDSYRKKDIDFIVTMQDSKEYTIEVKTDKWRTPNIYFETISSIENNTPGCMYKTEADYIFYYFLAYKELYMLKRKDYVEWFDKNKLHLEGCRPKAVRNTNYTSAGYIVPKKHIIKEDFCKIIKNFE